MALSVRDVADRSRWIQKTPLWHRPVLVLNLSFEPIHVTTVRRALVLVWKNRATVEEVGDGEIHTPSRVFPMPSVIRLRRYVPYTAQRSYFYRKLLRHYPHLRCQYCERVVAAHEVTWDHIVPRSRGGPTRWDNLAIACADCNRYKGNRLPEEAGLRLRLDPRRIPRKQLIFYLRWLGLLDEKWRKYIYYEEVRSV